jgi:phosphatidylglycerophosphatase A
MRAMTHKSLPRLLCSCGGIGYLTRAPGTLASLVAVGSGAAILAVGSQMTLLLASLVVFAIGWWACRHLPESGDDPGWVVIDEVAGQWLALACIPLTLPGVLAAFLLFRLFDIRKPWPVSWADRQLAGPVGIMLDDMLAGLYAGGILLLAGHVW